MQNNNNHGVTLGPELEAEISQLLARRYKRYLAPHDIFVVSTEIGHAFAAVNAVFRAHSDAHEYEVSVCVECEPNQIQNPMDAHAHALNAMDDVWGEFFEAQRIFHYPENWLEYHRDNMKVLLRVEHRNPHLDAQADAFLREHGIDASGFDIVANASIDES